MLLFSRNFSLVAVATLLLSQFTIDASPSAAADGAARTGTDSKSDLENESPVPEADRKEVDQILQNIERDWNGHSLEAVMSYYADDYMNNDGLDKKAVSALTQDFWKTYPDAKSSSITKQIRIEGNFATIESKDMATGTTAKEMPGIGTRGELKSLSEGQLYLKKIGSNWKIIGDRIDYEKVRVAFGLARQLDATFAAPEQVKAGKQFSAKLEVELPTGLTAVGSITATPLQYPQPQPQDAWKPINDPSTDRPLLERVMYANTKNRNELLMATIGLTNSSRNSLMGIAFLTRRLNVVPNMEEDKTESKDTSVKAENKSELRLDSKESKDETKTDSKTDPKTDPKIDTKSDTKSNTKSNTKPETNSDIKSEDKPNSSSETEP